MIAEVLKRKLSRPFNGLATYLCGKPERVEESFFLNCSFDDFDLNLKEINALQNLAKSKADKTYHFVLSLREGEKLNRDEIERAVRMQLKALGYEYHQALITAHNDTANFHIHVGVNKVCPKTKRTKTPYKDFEKLDKTCEKLEKIFGLQQDNRVGQKTNKTKRLYDGRQSFQEWVSILSPEIMNGVNKAKTWQEVHFELARFNLYIKQRGAGFVISDIDNKLFMKASAVDRGLSKKALESIFGEFEKPDLKNLPKPVLKYDAKPEEAKESATIYKEFEVKEKMKKQERYEKMTALYKLHSMRIFSLKQWYKDSKADLKKDLFIARRERRTVLQRYQANMKTRLEEIFNDFQEQKKQIIKETKPLGWNSFLRDEAMNGRRDVLDLLRSRPIGTRTRIVKNNFFGIKKPSAITPGFHTISRKGELIYTFGKVQVRDKGKAVSFFGDFSDEKGLTDALRFLSDKKDSGLVFNGTDGFKDKILEAINKHNINIKSENLRSGQAGKESQGQGR
ncbi:MAG: relaxase/mobilization nuclease domain-containing protein [Proteobacteria bacterium]|nr:relaxase/mobilization nuclease domain-containing protein [Pseudomonadota bacterium]MBU1543956.1 relaxase/mobilization nuclease domain-containing protein [Pseudomonadota bacterium]MBU2479931.1 relaxase/mobilization nuclease domain-containing protein [Pseudomonadota bacterium]